MAELRKMEKLTFEQFQKRLITFFQKEEILRIF